MAEIKVKNITTDTFRYAPGGEEWEISPGQTKTRDSEDLFIQGLIERDRLEVLSDSKPKPQNT